MRAVLDPNVLISALISRSGAPARLLAACFAGAFDLVVSEALLDELERALAYPKIRERVSAEEADDLLAVLRRTATVASDVSDTLSHSRDQGDDYLLALAAAERAVLVSGDADLLELSDRLPVQSPRSFLDELESA